MPAMPTKKLTANTLRLKPLLRCSCEYLFDMGLLPLFLIINKICVFCEQALASLRYLAHLIRLAALVYRAHRYHHR